MPFTILFVHSLVSFVYNRGSPRHKTENNLARLGVCAARLAACARGEATVVAFHGAAGLQLVQRVHRRLLRREVLHDLNLQIHQPSVSLIHL